MRALSRSAWLVAKAVSLQDHNCRLFAFVEFRIEEFEVQGWASLTEKIKSDVSKQEKQSRSQQKTERPRHLSELLLPANCFRLAWRNHVQHVRKEYGDAEARPVPQHVGEYLKALATALQ